MPRTITVKAKELFDEKNQKFIYLKKDTDIVVEHSLLSISKWESKYKRPFLDEKKGMQTDAEILDYIRFMTITPQNPDPLIYLSLSKKNIEDIIEYINDPQTATWFSNVDKNTPKPKSVLTNEVIYWEMIQYNLPIEICQKWHLNRLLTLLRVCDAKSGDGKKMSKQDILARNSKLNAQRLAAAAKSKSPKVHR